MIIKKADYMVVMRSAFWAQGWWFAEDPILSGPLQQSLEDFCLFSSEFDSRSWFSRWNLLTSAHCVMTFPSLTKITRQNAYHH